MSAALGHLSYFLRDFSVYIALIIVSFLVFVGALYFIFKAKEKDFVHKVILGLAFSIFLSAIVFSAFEGYFRYVYDKSDTLGF